MPHMFVNRTRYHHTALGDIIVLASRHHHPRPLLLGLQRFSSWPPPGTRQKRHEQLLEQEAEAPGSSSGALEAFRLLHHPTGDDAHIVFETFNTVAYELGGIIFIAGSVAFLPAYQAYLDLGVYLFIIGSLLYLMVAAHDLLEVLQAAQEEDDDDDDREDDDSEEEEEEDETTKATTNKSNSSKSKHHFSRTTRFRLDLTASLIYVTGSILFIIGSWVFLPSIEQPKLGAALFILGSILFCVGSLINMVQIFIEDSHASTAICANLTAAFYLIGSTMFAVASVPYLFDFEDLADANLIYTFLGWNYILGSAAFTVGGTINYIRARIVLRDAEWQARQRRIETLHLQHKQQHYQYNQTWSAKTAAAAAPMLLYPPPTDNDKDGNDGDNDDRTSSTSGVVWKDLQQPSVETTTQSPPTEALLQVAQKEGRSKTAAKEDGASQLVAMFQDQNEKRGEDDDNDETTSLLARSNTNPSSDGAAAALAHAPDYGTKLSNLTTTTTTTTSSSTTTADATTSDEAIRFL